MDIIMGGPGGSLLGTDSTMDLNMVWPWMRASQSGLTMDIIGIGPWRLFFCLHGSDHGRHSGCLLLRQWVAIH